MYFFFFLQVNLNQFSCLLIEGDILNFDRIIGKQYDFVYRDDIKFCFKLVIRCEQCRVVFNILDKVIIKSVGVCERIDKVGKIVKYIGNVYLYYLINCLKEYD